MKFLRTTFLAIMASALFALSPAAAGEKLTLQTFNPGEKSLFPVASTLVTGPTEALLIDAQFQRDDAQAVLQMIRDSGKALKTIYISHGDPDFYFGLDVILAAYPEARVVASPTTVEHIEKTVERKLSYWGPILGDNAPTRTIVPEVITTDRFTVDGEELRIVGLDGHDPRHSFVWVPSAGTVVGGVLLYEGVHVWMADAQTQEARNNWRQSLDAILALSPERIIPGHVIGSSSETAEIVAFTRDYIGNFEKAAASAQTSEELVSTMTGLYPDFTNLEDLKLSAKVATGEMSWP